MRARIDRLTDNAQLLVATESINPAFGGSGEASIANVTESLMQEAGLEVRRFEGRDGRPSVVGRLRGDGRAPALMLNAHYDTVGVHGMPDPFAARVQDGRLYGRGAYDMKGSLAACFEATRLVQEAGVTPLGDVLVAAVADEEYGSLGTAELVKARNDGELGFGRAIVTEPTALKLCVAHRGFTWLEVTTHGRAAHGSRYQLGIDANVRMGRFLAAFEEFAASLQQRPGHQLLGPPSAHCAVLQGGVGLSTYAAQCTLKIERRTVPPETLEDVELEIDSLLRGLRREDPSLQIESRILLHREPFETNTGTPVCRGVMSAAKTVLGHTPDVVGDDPWMDSALTRAAGVDTVVIGPRGSGAHADVEWVDLASCCRLAEILARTACNIWN